MIHNSQEKYNHVRTHIHTRAHALQKLITAAMFLFVICVYIYSKHSCDLGIASLMVSPWIQCYLKPGSTKLARKAYRNQSEVAQHTTMLRKLLKTSVQNEWCFHYLNNFHTQEMWSSHISDQADYYPSERWHHRTWQTSTDILEKPTACIFSTE